MQTRWETMQLLAALIAPKSEVRLSAVVSWEALIAASSHHLVTPALAWALQGAAIPDEEAGYLEAVLDLNRTRNQAMMTALADALAVLNRNGIAPMLLKGAASQADALYPDPAIRILGDLDILAPPGRAEECHALLAANGFAPEGDREYGPTHHHLKPLRHGATGQFVELHRAPGFVSLAPLLPPDAFWRDARPTDFLGRSAFLPGPTDRFGHALVHTMLQDGYFRAGTLTLRQMLELAMLLQRYRDEIAWPALAERFRAAGHFAVLQQGCEMVHRLFGMARVEQVEPCARNPLAPFRAKLERRMPSPARILRRALDAIRARPAWALDYLRPTKMPGRALRLLKHFRAARWTP